MNIQNQATTTSKSLYNGNINRQIISRKELCLILGVSLTTVIKLSANDDTFPKPITLNTNRKYYSKAEIDNWIERKTNANRIAEVSQ